MPADRQGSSSAIRQRGSRQRVPSYSSRTGAESAVRAWRAAGARSAAVTSTGSTRTGSATGCPAPAARATGRSSPPAASRSSRGPSARDDLDREAAPHELRLDVGPVDRAREPAELEVERGGVGLDRRRDLGAEEARLEAAEAAHRPEALALAGGGLERRGPVGLDAESRRLDREALVAGGEDDRDARDPVEAPLEQRPRLAAASSRPLDAGDRDAVGDPRCEPANASPTSAARTATSASETSTQRATRRADRCGTEPVWKEVVSPCTKPCSVARPQASFVQFQ